MLIRFRRCPDDGQQEKQAHTILEVVQRKRFISTPLLFFGDELSDLKDKNSIQYPSDIFHWSIFKVSKTPEDIGVALSLHLYQRLSWFASRSFQFWPPLDDSRLCDFATRWNFYKSPAFQFFCTSKIIERLITSSLLQPFSKISRVGIVRRGLHFLAELSDNLRGMISPSFDDRISRLRKLLKTHEDTSDAVTLVLKDLSSYFPYIHVIPKGVWPNEPRNRISVQTHLKSTFAYTVNLLETTGRNISWTDEHYLSLLLTHSCGWSATYPEHMNDPWFTEFFKVRYPQFNWLIRILDSMTYEEELVHFQDEYHFRFP